MFVKCEHLCGPNDSVRKQASIRKLPVVKLP